MASNQRNSDRIPKSVNHVFLVALPFLIIIGCSSIASFHHSEAYKFQRQRLLGIELGQEISSVLLNSDERVYFQSGTATFQVGDQTIVGITEVGDSVRYRLDSVALIEISTVDSGRSRSLLMDRKTQVRSSSEWPESLRSTGRVPPTARIRFDGVGARINKSENSLSGTDRGGKPIVVSMDDLLSLEYDRITRGNPHRLIGVIGGLSSARMAGVVNEQSGSSVNSLGGYNVGVSMVQYLRDYLSVQLDLLLAKRGGDRLTRVKITYIDVHVRDEILLTYVDVPVLFKLTANNWKPVSPGLYAGPYFSILIGTETKLDSTASVGGFAVGATSVSQISNARATDYGFTVGTELAIEIGPARLAMDFRYARGLVSLFHEKPRISVSGRSIVGNQQTAVEAKNETFMVSVVLHMKLL